MYSTRLESAKLNGACDLMKNVLDLQSLASIAMFSEQSGEKFHCFPSHAFSTGMNYRSMMSGHRRESGRGSEDSPVSL